MHVASHPSPAIEALVRRLSANGTPLACITLISDPDLANRLADHTVVMFRQVWNQYERYNANLFFRGLDPNSDSGRQRAERLGYEFFYDRAGHFPFTERLRRDRPIYIKHRNETGWHPLDAYFDIGVMKAANERGNKVAICGDSVGTPEIWQWAQRAPALRFAMAHGHVCTLNEYGRENPPDSDVSDPLHIEWYGLRHRQFYAAVPADCRPKLIIGETGSYDSTKFRGAARVINDMRRYNELLLNDEYVIGYCYWTAGEWSGFPLSSLDSALPEIEALVREVC